MSQSCGIREISCLVCGTSSVWLSELTSAVALFERPFKQWPK